MANARVSALERELREADNALEFATAVMTDLLLTIGTRETCSKCGRSVFWLRSRGGSALLVNVDGTMHWPRCAQTPRTASALDKPA